MNHNRRLAVATLSETVSTKPGRNRTLSHSAAESIFWVALDWATSSTLSGVVGRDDDAYEAWLCRYDAATLLARS